MVSWDVDGQFMTEEDEKDFERFLEGLAFFGKLDAQQAMEHMKQHKEARFVVFATSAARVLRLAQRTACWA